MEISTRPVPPLDQDVAVLRHEVEHGLSERVPVNANNSSKDRHSDRRRGSSRAAYEGLAWELGASPDDRVDDGVLDDVADS